MAHFFPMLVALSLGLAHTALGGSRAAFHNLGTSQLHMSHSRRIMSGPRPRTSRCSMDASDIPFDADLKMLQDRIKNSMRHSAAVQSMPKHMGEGYVLIFNVGTEQEGVYTLQYEEDTCILVFEASEEAHRFAGLLEAEDFDLPTAIKWSTKQIQEFCAFSQIKLGLIPQGSHLMPPEHNVYEEGLNGEDPKWPGIQDHSSLDEMRQRLDRLFNEPGAPGAPGI